MSMTDRELLEFIVAQLSTIVTDGPRLEKELKNIKMRTPESKVDVADLKVGVSEIQETEKRIQDELSDFKSIVMDMNKNHGEMLNQLLELQKQNTDTLDRIEKKIFMD